MLISFAVGNFLSFKEIQVLSLLPEPFKDMEENLHVPYHYDHKERLLKSVAIYGHNSYGKSNFIRAFQFLQNFIFTSFSSGQTQNKIPVEPFRLNSDAVHRPSFFEIIFLIAETKYRYRVLISKDEVLDEELYYAQAKIRENHLFRRKGEEIVVSKSWNKEYEGKIDTARVFAKRHILFLSVLISQQLSDQIKSIGKWLSSNIIVPDNYLDELSKARLIYSDATYRTLILKFIERADIGFVTIFDKLENLSKNSNMLENGLLNMWYDREIKNFELYTTHNIYNDGKEKVGTIEWEFQKNESAGSIKYFVLVCLLSYAIKNSFIIWVDELDSRFDSSLLEMLIKSFHDRQINPINSQLVFTTHNTVLLDRKLRRDQMFIVEKNEQGESTLQRIHSKDRPLRINKSIEKEYRRGKLGGVSKKIRSDLGPELFD